MKLYELLNSYNGLISLFESVHDESRNRLEKSFSNEVGYDEAISLLDEWIGKLRETVVDEWKLNPILNNQLVWFID